MIETFKEFKEERKEFPNTYNWFKKMFLNSSVKESEESFRINKELLNKRLNEEIEKQ